MKRIEVARVRGSWRVLRSGEPFGPRFTKKSDAIRHSLDLEHLEDCAANTRKLNAIGPRLFQALRRAAGRPT